MTSVDLLTPRDESAAVATLAAAFVEYPLFPPLCPRPEWRFRAVVAFCRFLFRVAMRHKGVYSTRDRLAVACALPPGTEWPSEWSYLRAGALSVAWRMR